MRNIQRWVSILLINSIVVVMTQMCTISHYADDCGNKGLLWNCSGLNISKLPTELPPELENNNVTLDLSFNQISSLTEDIFQHIARYSKVTAIILKYNSITEIAYLAFQKLTSLCSLDLSYAHLERKEIDSEAFSNLDKLQVLQIHGNDFQYSGYPDISLSRIHSLEHLKIDIFHNFSFTKPFENLTKLSQLEFHVLNAFKLTNASFQGLRYSPIHNLTMNFSSFVDCDVPEDLFCSFPYLDNEIEIYFGGDCDVYAALKSLKCLQNQTIIQKLDLRQNKKAIVTDPIILNEKSAKYLVNICVRVLNLGSCHIGYFKVNLHGTTLWKCLDSLDIDSNNMIYVSFATVSAIFSMPKLKKINACCNNNKNLMLGNSSHRVLGNDYLSVNITLPKNLEVLDCSGNYVHNALRWTTNLSLIGEKLQKLDLQHTNFPLNFKGTFNLPSLSFLNLSENTFKYIHPDIFQNVRNLRILKAVDIGVGHISENLFKNLRHLVSLDFSQNSLRSLPRSLLRDQRESLLEIILDRNMFTALPDVLIKHEKVQMLSIRYNLISKFSERDKRLYNSIKNLSFLLEGNPISCSCVNIQSLRWMKDHQNSILDLSTVLCAESRNPINQLFHDQVWVKFELNCQATDWLIFSLGLLVFTVIALITIGAIKKYRVHLEYVILRVKNRLKGMPLRISEDDVFLYDVFVSYDEVDYSWILGELYPKLERLGVTAWLTDKDSIPGRPRSEEIVSCVTESRKVMFVVSESFMDKGWFSYAVQMAITHAFHNQRQRSIVVLIKDGVPLERLPDEMKNIWWCIEHFRWPENDGTCSDEVILSELSNILKPE
ncbi:toll-like receptor 2 [Crassostrea angulata]|uniref:toll-like receptor 2 n=1 Tax=Magallana angulata TaxID=2784310 RepID=UPI0022B1D560|nr:toll-like receptor 2 [Crassostrea angulata]